MKAIVQEKYGSPDDLRLRDVDEPPVAADEVLVRVRAASMHPDIWHVVSGTPYVVRLMGNGLFKPRHLIPGTDMAGTVAAVGASVTQFRRGDAVFGETIRTHQWTNGGAFAEYVSVREEWLARKPHDVTFEQAAAVPTSGYIALVNLRGGNLIQPGHDVLVNGAGGGVGALALQIAKARGARVTGVDGPSKQQLLRTLGADHVIDHTQQDFTRSGALYDVIFDVPGNYRFDACARALKPDGKYVLIGHERFGPSGNPVVGLFPRLVKLIAMSLFRKQLRLGRSSVPSRNTAMRLLSELLAAGKITPVIDSVYPLSETPSALRHMMEDELHGKVIVVIE